MANGAIKLQRVDRSYNTKYIKIWYVEGLGLVNILYKHIGDDLITHTHFEKVLERPENVRKLSVFFFVCLFYYCYIYIAFIWRPLNGEACLRDVRIHSQRSPRLSE